MYPYGMQIMRTYAGSELGDHLNHLGIASDRRNGILVRYDHELTT